MDEAIALRNQMDELEEKLDVIQKEVLFPRFKKDGLESVEHNGFTFLYVKGYRRFNQQVATEYAVTRHGIPFQTMKDIFDNGKGAPGEDYLQIRKDRIRE